MRVAKKKPEKKPEALKPVSSTVEARLAMEAANTAQRSAEAAQESVSETAILVRELVESMADKDQLIQALTKVLEERRTLPFRAIPVRDDRGVAKHYDFIQIKKVAH